MHLPTTLSGGAAIPFLRTAIYACSGGFLRLL